jgi:hypothetical protein
LMHGSGMISAWKSVSCPPGRSSASRHTALRSCLWAGTSGEIWTNCAPRGLNTRWLGLRARLAKNTLARIAAMWTGKCRANRFTFNRGSVRERCQHYRSFARPAGTLCSSRPSSSVCRWSVSRTHHEFARERHTARAEHPHVKWCMATGGGFDAAGHPTHSGDKDPFCRCGSGTRIRAGE